MPAREYRIDERVTFQNCEQCGCASSGVVTGYSDAGFPIILWDPPEVAGCDHDCHGPWRMANQQPAAAEAT